MFKKRVITHTALNNTNKTTKIQDLVLSTAKLKFNSEQLLNLNFILIQRLYGRSSFDEKAVAVARSVSERLIQRLVCCTGILDQRFASKFLIRCDENEDFATSLAYIVRLDTLSTPLLYETDLKPKYSIIENDPEYPAAYARIRLQGATLKKWNDCANSAGYLRRDKVQAKLVELLAEAASADFPSSPLNVDESLLCGTPGKVVPANTLSEILKTSSNRHVFYGPKDTVPRFPDPRDFRLAIVDEPDGIRIKIEFLSPTLANISVDVRILVAIGADAWPSSTDFPARVTIGHTDALLYHQAAQAGFYLVGYGVQSSAWQIRAPAAQALILHHYGPNSTIHTILDVLYFTLTELDRNRKPNNYKILTKYMLLTQLLRELEITSTTPSNDLLAWSPMHLSTHVLKILDRTIFNLQNEHLANYFFKKANLLVNPGHLCDDDYMLEAHNVKLFLFRLFDESLTSLSINSEFDRFIQAQQTETVLLCKWRELVESLAPPNATRGRRFCFAGSRNRQEVAYTAYTHRQLEYIGLLLEHLLIVKQKITSRDYFNENEDFNTDDGDSSHLEDVIYLLVTIMDQARDQYLLTQTNPTIIKNKAKIRTQFNTCTATLVDVIRKDKETQITFEDNMQLVKVLLKWLYKAMDHNKRSFGPILRPYLASLFASSHSISWHLDCIRQRLNTDEMDALGEFSQLVIDGIITPAEGLVDAVNKNWIWAQEMIKLVESGALRVIFIWGRGKVARHVMSLPCYGEKEGGGDNEVVMVEREVKGMSLGRDYFSTVLTKSGKKPKHELNEVPEHEILKNSSPMTLIANDVHRRGEHRGYGDILKSLQAMQKLNMFQQVTSSLPKDEREQILDLIRSMEMAKTKRTTNKRWSNTLPQSRRVGERAEKYTAVEESAGVAINEVLVPKCVGSLIGSCRKARIREDSSVFLLQDSFRVRNLLNKSESFKF